MNSSHRASRVATAVFASFALPICLWSQFASGTITGVVKDSTNAIIQGAVVTVTEQQTGTAIKVSTQNDGAFTAPNLAPAEYSLAVEANGFKRLVVAGLKVDVGSILSQDLVLEVGATTESVSVVGQTSLVETAHGAVGTTVQVSHVLEMPLVDRNVFNLVNLVPGAFSSAGLVSIGGGRLQTASALIDGVINSRGGVAANGIELTPPVESMQEFKVEVNSFGAEFGHTNGGVVNAVTRSGTNQFHGNAYEFLRNDKLDAKGWGNDALPPLRRNNFGGSIG